MATTARAAAPYPTGSQKPDVNGDIQKVAEWADGVVGAPLVSSLPASGFDGQLVFLSSAGTGYRRTGAQWVPVSIGTWQTWADPVISGVPGSSVGSRWRYVGSGVEAEIAFNASGAGSGSIAVQLPIASGTYRAQWNIIGMGGIRDVSAGHYRDVVFGAVLGGQGPIASVDMKASTPGSQDLRSTVTATAPFAWASGDTISGQLRYSL